jgi:methylaspartate ammonia-lyase
MNEIIDVITAEGRGAFFNDDQMAVRNGACTDGFSYVGPAVTTGFTAIRMPARSLGVGLVLSNGDTVWGDMMSVQYSGGSGRDPVFDPTTGQMLVDSTLRSRLMGLRLESYRASCNSALRPIATGSLPRAVEYGVSQALLRAMAQLTGTSMAEILCTEFGLPVIARAVPLYAQSGDARAINVDKMILKGVDVLPHGLINSREKFGPDGRDCLEFIGWVARRVQALGQFGYRPILHFDVYGWIGLAVGMDPEPIAEFIVRAEKCAEPFDLQIEHPADFGSRLGQIQGLRAIREALARRGSKARIVADEWCNDLEDIRAFATAESCHLIQIKMPDVGSVVDTMLAAIECRKSGVGVYIGGSCTETELSAHVSIHVALAVQADMILAKPGMGVDEGLTIIGNEQSRLLASLRRSHPQPSEIGGSYHG